MRKRIKDIRREELLLATLDTIHAVGLQNITVAKLSATAGMSQGMVHHYFKNKAEIIEAAIRYVNAKLRDDVINQVNSASSPTERLFKIIDVNFSAHWFNTETAQLWVSFCAEVPFNPTFHRIQHAIHSRMQSNLLSCLKKIIPDNEATNIAYELSNMIDGLWLRLSVNSTDLTPEKAIICVTQYLNRVGIYK
ncbi:MAG: transcriptional regulator BetI [Amphritea sp.]|nr:transcriptional regulator BetI [Amphritea sp.]